MKRRRRRGRSQRMVTGLLTVGVVVFGGWWLWPDGEPQAGAQTRPAEVVTNTANDSDSPDIPIVVITDPPAELPLDQSSDEAGTAKGAASQSEPDAPAKETGTIALNPGDGSSGASTGTAGEDVDESMPPSADSSDSEAPMFASATPEPTERDPEYGSSKEQMSSNARIDAALQRYREGKRIEARTELNRMLQTAADADLNRELRRHLARIADETVFSRETVADDPLFARHPLGDGEYLSEVQSQYDVPYEMIMLINGIKNANRVRAGQVLKVPRGPFHVVIHKSAFRLDLYLQDLYIKSFPVGLGADSSTPVGDWIVKNRLPNPTYYPPASAADKRIIGPDDPTNPLGEFWVGLEGISGGAVGQEGFGIHGTIEPTSIGKNASMGCVRMHDDDIRFVYTALLDRKSKVKTVP